MPTLAELIDTYAPPRPPPPAWSTGLGHLDEATCGGFAPGEAWLVTGAPGQGRTMLLLQWAIHLARSGHRVDVRSPLESEASCFARLVAGATKVPQAELRRGALGVGSSQRLARQRDELATWPLRLTTEGVQSEWDFVVPPGKPRPDVYVLDDLDTYGWATHSSDLVHRLTTLGCLVLCSAARSEVIPDGFAVGAVAEQWAGTCDVVADVRYLDLQDTRLGEADLSLLRNRKGPPRTLRLAFQGHYARFAEMADAPSSP